MTKKNDKKIDKSEVKNSPIKEDKKMIVNPLEPTEVRPDDIAKIEIADIKQLNEYKEQINRSKAEIRKSIVMAGGKLKHIKVEICGSDNQKFGDTMKWYRKYGHLEIERYDISRFIYIADNMIKCHYEDRDGTKKVVASGLGISDWLADKECKQSQTVSPQTLSKGHKAFIQFLLDWNDDSYVPPKKDKPEEKSLVIDKRSVSRLIADMNQIIEKVKGQIENAGSVINKKDSGILMGVSADIEELIA